MWAIISLKGRWLTCREEPQSRPGRASRPLDPPTAGHDAAGLTDRYETYSLNIGLRTAYQASHACPEGQRSKVV
jgi:hypothetical protein